MVRLKFNICHLISSLRFIFFSDTKSHSKPKTYIDILDVTFFYELNQYVLFDPISAQLDSFPCITNLITNKSAGFHHLHGIADVVCPES